MDVTITFTTEPPPKGSILVCGLPGIAFIGKLAVDYLIRELGAKLVGAVYAPFFSPYVLIGSDGVVEILRNELYYLQDEGGRGIYFLTGNAQAASPEGQYALLDKVLETVLPLGVTHVYSIAAFLTDKPFERPTVYGIATTPSLVDGVAEWGVVAMDQGSISGMNGLILGLARMKQLNGTCLLGETHGYQTPTGQYIVDANAARAVLEILTAMLKLPVDMKPLEQQAAQMDDFLGQLAEVEKQVRDEMRRAADRDPSRYIT
jgi:uncharacterized protein (TIGR00162 family)